MGSDPESSSNVEGGEQSREPQDGSLPPTRVASSKKRDQIPNLIVERSNSSFAQLPPRKPALKRAETHLSRQYDHIQSKVDSKLEDKYIPGASQVRVPTFTRRSTYAEGGQRMPREKLESDILDADREGEEEAQAFCDDLDSEEKPTPITKVPSSHSDRSEDYFDSNHSSLRGGRSPYRSDSGSPSYSYRSRSDTQSATDSDFDSKSSSRKASFEHPTSNPADYAISTDSFKRKVYERREQGIEAKPPPAHRRKTMERRDTTPLSEKVYQLEREKAVRFEEPATPTTVKRGYLNRRTISEGQVLTLKSHLYEYLSESGSNSEPVPRNREDTYDVAEVEDVDFMETQVKDNEGAEKTLVEIRKQVETDRKIIQEQRETIRKMEVELQEAVEHGKRERIDSLQERDQTIEQLSKRITELEAVIRSMEEQRLADTRKISELEEPAKARDLQTHRTNDLEDDQKTRDGKDVDSENERALRQTLEKNEAQAQQIKQLEEALQQKRVDDAIATSTDTPEWQKVYLRKARINTAQEMEINHLKESVRKLDAYNPTLEREVRELRAYVTAHRDTVASLQDQLRISRSAEKEWKHEYEQQRDMLDQRTFAEDAELAELREEMKRTIAQYQALLPSRDHPDALEITGLLKKVSDLQDALKQTKSRLDNLKREKSTLEQEILATVLENNDLRKANEELKYGPPPLPRSIVDQESHEVLVLPAWNFEDLARRREAAVAEFRRKQEAQQEERETKDRLVEKAREAKMGKWYPPKRAHFGELQQKSRWEMWEGRRWIDEQSTPEEYDQAKKLGLLEERRKKWRTQDWKGKGLSDMGFKNRD